MIPMPKSFSAQKIEVFFFSSGVKHEEKEKEEEEIPQFRNCECILEITWIFFLISKYKPKENKKT